MFSPQPMLPLSLLVLAAVANSQPLVIGQSSPTGSSLASVVPQATPALTSITRVAKCMARPPSPLSLMDVCL